MLIPFWMQILMKGNKMIVSVEDLRTLCQSILLDRELEEGGTYVWLNQLRDPNWVVEVMAKRSTVEWAEPGRKVRTLDVFRLTGFRRALRVEAQSNRG